MKYLFLILLLFACNFKEEPPQPKEQYYHGRHDYRELGPYRITTKAFSGREREVDMYIMECKDSLCLERDTFYFPVN